MKAEKLSIDVCFEITLQIRQNGNLSTTLVQSDKVIFV